MGTCSGMGVMYIALACEDDRWGIRSRYPPTHRARTYSADGCRQMGNALPTFTYASSLTP